MRRHDAITADEAEALAPTHLVVSPGPGTPTEAGVSAALIERLAGRIPVLGVCLGHQVHRRDVRRRGRSRPPADARQGRHGRLHDGTPLLAGVPDRSRRAATTRWPRIEPLPEALVVTARDRDGEVMGVRHRERADARRAVPPRVRADARRAGGSLENFLAMRGRA